MIPIYLCEDNPQQLNYIATIIRSFLLFNDLNQNLLFPTTDPYVLLKELTESPKTGIYFLDIDLHSDIDGLELAQKIRKCDPRGYIIFITTHSEMATLTFSYRVEAMDFIIKDEPQLLRKRIFLCLQTSIETDSTLQKQNNNIISLKMNQSTIALNTNDIVFIETDLKPHKVIIHLSHEIKQVSISLKELQASLDSRFFRCHTSILINLNHIFSYQAAEKKILFDNGESCDVSLRRARGLKTAIKNNHLRF